MNAEPKRTCPSCGNEFSGAMEFCPVCMLRAAIPGAVESGASSFEEAAAADGSYEPVSGSCKPVDPLRGRPAC
jgi:hypothetical protein